MDLVVGIFTGMMLVGASTQRTMDVLEGKMLRVFVGCIVISFAHYYMVHFATKGDISGYIGFSLGATLITCYQSYRRNKGRKA